MHTYSPPTAGTRTAYVQRVATSGQAALRLGTYSTQEAGTRSPYVPYGAEAAPERHVSAQRGDGEAS